MIFHDKMRLRIPQVAINESHKRVGNRLKMWYHICNLLDNARTLLTRAGVVRYCDAKLT